MTKRLGKGLADLIGAPSIQTSSSFVMLRVDQIRPGRFQPRTLIDDASLEELKASIKRSGVIEPIIVRPIAHGTYEVVAGERRLKAAQAIGIQEVPSIIRSLSDKETLEISLVENIQRANLNPVDEAKGYARLLDEFGYTQEDIAAAIGKDRVTIANLLRVLSLPEEILQALREEKISLGHAKAFLGVTDRVQQLTLFQAAMSNGLSVRAVEAKVSVASPGKRRRAKRFDPQLKQLEDAMRQALGTRVVLASRAKGGRITIDYFSSDDLNRILQLLGVSV
jgi:ParB family chromosome partitioning protein